MPSKNFAMMHMGITLGSAVFKPVAISSTVVAFQRRRHPVMHFKSEDDISLQKRRFYCNTTSGSSNSSSKPTSSVKSAPDMSLSQTLSTSTTAPVPSTVSVSSTSNVNISYPSGPLESLSVKELREDNIQTTTTSTFKAGDIDAYFDLSQSFTRSEKWKSMLVNSMLVYPDFISQEEEESILKEIEPYISRLHYENSHWDDAIHEYRETERSKWNKKNEKIINRIRELAFPPGIPQLKLVHVLDLARKGVIKPHIDSIRFCGNTIAGLSLLSSCVMRLRHDVQTDFYCDVYLPRFSLYVMKDFSRFEFTHEILGEADSKFKKEVIKRDRRISVICRNEPENAAGPVFNPINV